ncbi:MAG: hypothetical protein DHS20C21_04640 [Gemmatimonadota bacterium]|nr:MAG: hypothetical protein DHS20C21_04640 [Gemmatimonadota bacterium]
MAESTLRRVPLAGLAALALGAFGLRVLWIGFGLPETQPEERWVTTFSSLGWSMGPGGVQPLAGGVHQCLLWLESVGAFLALRVLGLVNDPGEFATWLAGDPTQFLTVARIGAALAGAATVVVLARHAAAEVSVRAGWVAGLFLAVAGTHVELSRRVSGDAVQVLLIGLVWLAIADEAARRRRWPGWALALLLGATLRCGWPSVLLLIPYVVALRPLGGRTLGAAAAGLVLAAIPDPLGLLGLGVWGAFAIPNGDTIGGAFAELARTGGAMGPAMALLAVLGIALGWLAKRPVVAWHAGFALAVIVAGVYRIPGETGLHALLPSVCLLAGVALDDLAQRLRPLGRGVVPAAAVLAAVVALEPAWTSFRSNRQDAQPTTVSLAAAWIRSHLEHRSVVVCPGTVELYGAPLVPIPNLKKNLKERAAYLENMGAREAVYWSHRVEALAPPLYDLRVVEASGVWPSMAVAREWGVEYAVIPTGDFVGGGGKALSQAKWSRRHFYEELLNAPQVELLGTFEPDDTVRGPSLELWRIGSSGG